MLELDFTIRTVALGAVLLGITSGVLGSFAVLRQQSLLGETLSHAALPGICLGFLLAGGRQLGPLLLGALLSGALAALLVLLFIRRSRLKTDAALGIVLSVFFAVGIVLLTYIANQDHAGQAGLDAFLFGQAAAMLPGDVALMAWITTLALALVLAFWKEFKAVSFDPGYSASLGLPVLALEVLMTLMVALAIVIGLQLVGVVLMAAMLIAPAAAARQWTKGLGSMVALAALFGAVSGLAGALVSASARGLATGPLIVIAASLLVAASLLLAPERGLLSAAWRAYRARRNLPQQRVLIDLYRLAVAHQDPGYPVEQGMLASLYGFDPGAVLARLRRQGWIRPLSHEPTEQAHWALTEAGYRQAAELWEH